MIMEFWKQRKKLVSRLTIFFTMSISISPLYSKSGYWHSMDMLSVLGLNSVNNQAAAYQNYEKLKTMFDSINNLIDQNISNEFYTELKETFKYFNYGEYGHRIMYHWAFDIDKDISDFQFQKALAQLFNAKISAPVATSPKYISLYEKLYGKPLTDEIWHKEWNRFKIFIQRNQEKCNNELINIVRNNLGTNSGDSRDIAAILYYVHLLGDHVEHSGELTGFSVLEIKTIVNNIDLHVKNLSKNNKGNYTLYKNAINNLSKGDERSYAESIIHTMSNYIPQIIKFRFSNEFARKNLQFIFEEGLLKAS